MAGFGVQPGALAARAGKVDTSSAQVAAAAAAVRGVEAGEMPPRTAAALESALHGWPAALRRLAAALDRTAAALRSADSAYGATDHAVGRAAGGDR
jgi:uncharacterized protein YukE